MDLLGFGFFMMPSCLPLELVVGSGKTEWIRIDGLKSYAIASFIQILGLFVVWGLRGTT